MAIERKRELRRRRCRRAKIQALRERLAKTTEKAERERLLAKLQRLSPAAGIPAKAAYRKSAARK